MRIAIIIEGRTENVFLPHLRDYLSTKLAGNMPKMEPHLYDGPIPTGDKLRTAVTKLLTGNNPADHVIALTDVYHGRNQQVFRDARDAKRKMSSWVRDSGRFHPHAAQYDFEAWLLPFWPTIQKLAKTNRTAPSGDPEKVNHMSPPSYRIKDAFEAGHCRDSYIKVRDAKRILAENDLSVSVDQCGELKALVNTILTICGAPPIQ